MSFIKKICIGFIFFFLSIHSLWADNIDRLEEVLSEYEVNFPDRIYLEDTLEIDISNLWETLSENFSEFPLEYQWEIFSQDPQSWPVLEVKFDSFWMKTIELQIFTTTLQWESDSWDIILPERKLIFKSTQNIFVYEKSIPIITSSLVSENDKNNFISSAQDQWVLLYSLWDYSEASLSWDEIIKNLNTYKLSFSEKSDYITLWWEKEFLFSTLSKLNTQSLESSWLNLVLLTSYNTSILKNYISNSISGKNFIETWFIIDESIRNQMLKNPQKITMLLDQIDTNSYEYTLITDDTIIKPYLIISRFISTLSNDWVNLSDIYIILLLPIFLTIVAVSKHFIGLSTLWSIIPVFIGLLYIKLWVLFTLGLFVFLLIINVIISKLISKYTLLYTPKVTFITILNFIVFMWVFLVLKDYWFINIQLNNIIYIIIFFVVAEKFITIVASKEFREYKKSFSWTIIVSLLCFFLFNYNTFLVFLTAYPELLILLIPFNFMLWRFTGLRITEYFRFREIARNMEE